jgi:hypothetical protein
VHKGLRLAAAGTLVLLAACAVGETREATHITDVSARLSGVVHSTVAGPTDFWFEYGTTTSYGSLTPTQTSDLAPQSLAAPVVVTVDELREGTEYHYRLCAEAADGKSFCGEDRTFTTTERRDSVVGEGTLTYTPPHFDFSWSVAITASADRFGASASGEVVQVMRLGPYVFSSEGQVTCLRIRRDRAAIGYQDTATSTYRVVFVRDDTDLVAFSSALEAPGNDCPDPTTASFVGLPPFLGFPPIFAGPGLSSGDFMFHNHPPPR